MTAESPVRVIDEESTKNVFKKTKFLIAFDVAHLM
jgi:hypothetical protein